MRMPTNSVFLSSAVPLPVENIDTDQIIPARFLKQVTKDGFGENVFRDWRYGKNDEPNPHFVLNKPLYRGSILVAGKNFGCGSSREHAAWALKQYGFDVVISSEFADIFRNNALNNGILPVEVSDEFLDHILKCIERDPTVSLEIDLDKQTCTIPDDGSSEDFEINPFKKQCLSQGMDELDYLISLASDVRAFEATHKIY